MTLDCMLLSPSRSRLLKPDAILKHLRAVHAEARRLQSCHHAVSPRQGRCLMLLETFGVIKVTPPLRLADFVNIDPRAHPS